MAIAGLTSMFVRHVASVVLIGGVTLGTGVTSAQDYPVKAIRVMTSDVGSPADISARMVAQGISASLGQPVIIENRGGNQVPDAVAKSPSDGYTLMFTGSIWIVPMLRKEVSYDTLRDFAPITWVTSSPVVLVTHPTLPAKTTKEVIALAKSKPGRLNYASAPSGSINHLSAELFKVMAGVDIVRIPYKGSGAAMVDLVAGQTQLSFAVTSSAAGHISAGRLRALAVSSPQPSALMPGLPSIAEAGGLPGYEAVSISGIFAPAKTPGTIINRLSQEILRFINQPEIRQRFLNNGAEAVGGSPEQFAAAIKTDIARWSKLIKDAGLRDD